MHWLHNIMIQFQGSIGCHNDTLIRRGYPDLKSYGFISTSENCQSCAVWIITLTFNYTEAL